MLSFSTYLLDSVLTILAYSVVENDSLFWSHKDSVVDNCNIGKLGICVFIKSSIILLLCLSSEAAYVVWNNFMIRVTFFGNIRIMYT